MQRREDTEQAHILLRKDKTHWQQITSWFGYFSYSRDDHTEHYHQLIPVKLLQAVHLDELAEFYLPLSLSLANHLPKQLIQSIFEYVHMYRISKEDVFFAGDPSKSCSFSKVRLCINPPNTNANTQTALVTLSYSGEPEIQLQKGTTLRRHMGQPDPATVRPCKLRFM
jgi:hypothetical protein